MGLGDLANVGRVLPAQMAAVEAEAVLMKCRREVFMFEILGGR